MDREITEEIEDLKSWVLKGCELFDDKVSDELVIGLVAKAAEKMFTPDRACMAFAVTLSLLAESRKAER